MDPVIAAGERLQLWDRSLEELREMRDSWVLNVYELQAVNEAISEAEEEGE